jgi:hypothetical protein
MMSSDKATFFVEQYDKKDNNDADSKSSNSSEKRSYFTRTSVGKSFQRGKDAISHAENHIKIFEQYLQYSKSLLSSHENELSQSTENISCLKTTSTTSEKRCFASPSSTTTKDSADHDFTIKDDDFDHHHHSSIDFGNEKTNIDVTCTPYSNSVLSTLSDDPDNDSKSSSNDTFEEWIKNCKLSGMQQDEQDEYTLASSLSGKTRNKECHFIVPTSTLGSILSTTTSRHRPLEGTAPNNSSVSKLSSKRLFDPVRLSAPQQRGSKVKKMRMGHGMLEQQEHEIHKPFKARPLPGGHYVSNDPYAMTKAALDKVRDKKSKETAVEAITGYAHDVDGPIITPSKHSGKIVDASIILASATTAKKNNSFSSIDNYSLAKQVQTQRKQETNKSPKRIKTSRVGKDIYDATTRLISKEFENQLKSTEEDDDEGGELHYSFDSEVEEEDDIVTLHQKIAKLQAELRMRRRKCLETIHALEDETQCKSLKDVGISEFQKMQEGQEEEEEHQADESASDDIFFKSSASVQKESSTSSERRIAVPRMNMGYSSPQQQSSSNNREPSLSSPMTPSSLDNKNHEDEQQRRRRKQQQLLYLRQKGWLDDLDRKRREAKDREINKIMKDLTGKPNLMTTNSSWLRAKEEHDALVEITKKREEISRQKKIEKENALRRLLQMKEMYNMQEQAGATTPNGDSCDEGNEEKKKKVVDPLKQAEYFNKLSQPLKRFKPGGENPHNTTRGSMKTDSLPPLENKEESSKQPLLLLRTEEAYCGGSGNLRKRHKNHKAPTTPSNSSQRQQGDRTNQRSNRNNSSTNDKNSPCKNDKITISFADMDDNEFAKVIQRILQNSKKETHQNKVVATRKAEVSNRSNTMLPHSPYNTSRK